MKKVNMSHINNKIHFIYGDECEKNVVGMVIYEKYGKYFFDQEFKYVMNNEEVEALLIRGAVINKDGTFYSPTSFDSNSVGFGSSEVAESPISVGLLNNKSIAHRGYSVGAPENTIPCFIMAKEKGFRYVELDVAYTSDNVLVLLHDNTIDRTSNGTGSISDFTYNSLLEYDFGSWFSDEFKGTKIATLREVLILCKNIGLHPYIEIKSNDRVYTQEDINLIVNEVKSCGMKGNVTYVSFDYRWLRYVCNADSFARVGFIGSSLDAVSTVLDKLKTETNEVFLNSRYPANEEVIASCIDNDIPLEVYTINDPSDLDDIHPYITGITTDELLTERILYEKSFIYNPPAYIKASSIVLDKNSIIFSDSEPQTLIATIEPSNSTGTIIWSSTDEDVATVIDGVVTPVNGGNCIITATIHDVSATCSVVVESNSSYTVTKVLVGCVGSNDVSRIYEGEAYSETFTAASSLYTLEGAAVSITMGGDDISSKYIDGVLTIDSVIGNIVIEISAVSQVNNIALVNYAFNISEESAQLTNLATGGDTYNTTVVGNYDASVTDRLRLLSGSYAKMTYSTKSDTEFTLYIRAAMVDETCETYGRLFRNNQDAISATYYVANSTAVVKLAGKAATSLAVSNVVEPLTWISSSANAGRLDWNFVGNDMHDYVYVGTGEYIHFYFDGNLVGSQLRTTYNSSSSISLGNLDYATNDYNLAIADYEKWQFYEFGMTAEEVSALIQS